MKRIKNLDLMAWFTQDHSTLSNDYLIRCKKFFDDLNDFADDLNVESIVQDLKESSIRRKKFK